MAYCHQCGAPVSEDARYCPSCGVALRTDATGSGPAASGPSTPPPPGDLRQTVHPGPSVSKSARRAAMLCHLLAFIGIIIPFGNLIGPLIYWLMKRHESPFIDAHGKEAVNFQISIFLYLILSFILVFVRIGVLLLVGLFFLFVVSVIMAAIRAKDGEMYRYPITFRLIS